MDKNTKQSNKMKNKILPATQKLIDLFVSMPSEVQAEFRQFIDSTDPWFTALNELEWTNEVDWNISLEFEEETPLIK